MNLNCILIDLPNPLGITGIVEINIDDGEPLYLFQKRESSGAAARGKIQHAFAGTIDLWPNKRRVTSSFKALVETELIDEVIKQNIGNGQTLNFLESDPKIIRHETLIGFIANPLYLFQPELTVLISYTIPSRECFSRYSKIFKDQHWKLKNIMSGESGKLTRLGQLNVASLEELEKFERGLNGYETRNLFSPALQLLRKHTHERTGT